MKPAGGVTFTLIPQGSSMNNQGIPSCHSCRLSRNADRRRGSAVLDAQRGSFRCDVGVITRMTFPVPSRKPRSRRTAL